MKKLVIASLLVSLLATGCGAKVDVNSVPMTETAIATEFVGEAADVMKSATVVEETETIVEDETETVVETEVETETVVEDETETEVETATVIEEVEEKEVKTEVVEATAMSDVPADIIAVNEPAPVTEAPAPVVEAAPAPVAASNQSSNLLEIKYGELVPAGVYCVEVLYGDDEGAAKSSEFIKLMPKNYILGERSEWSFSVDCLEAEKDKIVALAEQFGYEVFVDHISDYGWTWDQEVAGYNAIFQNNPTAVPF